MAWPKGKSRSEFNRRAGVPGMRKAGRKARRPKPGVVMALPPNSLATDAESKALIERDELRRQRDAAFTERDELIMALVAILRPRTMRFLITRLT